jgi:hypothetical protein
VRFAGAVTVEHAGEVDRIRVLEGNSSLGDALRIADD